MLLVELVLHHQSSALATSAAAPGGAGAATAAASSGDPLPVGAVSLAPAAEVHANTSSSSGTELAASIAAAKSALILVAAQFTDVHNDAVACQKSIDSIDSQISTIKAHLSKLGTNSESVAERNELISAIAKLESDKTELRSQKLLLLQIQNKLQDEKVRLREEEAILHRQQEALPAQSGDSKEAAGSLSQYYPITFRSHDCCSHFNFKSPILLCEMSTMCS
jgi:hypothetical protein